MSTVGRAKSTATIHREIRRKMNHHGAAIAEKIIAKALSGDSTAMLAATTLLLAANPQPHK
jgi:hypothetical protein